MHHISRECLGHHRKGTPGTGNVYHYEYYDYYECCLIIIIIIIIIVIIIISSSSTEVFLGPFVAQASARRHRSSSASLRHTII